MFKENQFKAKKSENVTFIQQKRKKRLHTSGLLAARQTSRVTRAVNPNCGYGGRWVSEQGLS